jgi:hypothetical protein
LRGIQGRSRSKLLQAFDNEANERLAHARRVKIFEKSNQKIFDTNCQFTNTNKVVNNNLFSLLIKKTSQKFS